MRVHAVWVNELFLLAMTFLAILVIFAAVLWSLFFWAGPLVAGAMLLLDLKRMRAVKIMAAGALIYSGIALPFTAISGAMGHSLGRPYPQPVILCLAIVGISGMMVLVSDPYRMKPRARAAFAIGFLSLLVQLLAILRTP